MNVALIFAGGTGSRMGNQARPKQFLELHNKPVIIYTLQAFETHEQIDGIVVVCKKDWIDFLNEQITKFELKKIAGVVEGGTSGQNSIYRGLEFCEKNYASDTCVLVHDGVRPLIDKTTITRCIDSVKKYGNAITVVPSIETIIREQDNTVQEIVDRTSCKMARAPQSFYLKDLLDAHRRAQGEHLDKSFIDSASLMQYYGHKLHVVEGNRENIKITTPIDFYSFAGLVDGAAGVFGSA